jgi:hypothetical protein
LTAEHRERLGHDGLRHAELEPGASFAYAWPGDQRAGYRRQAGERELALPPGGLIEVAFIAVAKGSLTKFSMNSPLTSAKVAECFGTTEESNTTFGRSWIALQPPGSRLSEGSPGRARY